jgi:hypothetical protein
MQSAKNVMIWEIGSESMYFNANFQSYSLFNSANNSTT